MAKRGRNNKQHPDRKIAMMLFVNGGKSLTEIAQELDLTIKTVSKWKEQDNWEEERHIYNVAPTQLIKKLYEEMNGIIDGAKGEGRRMHAKESDSVIKISKAINILRNRLDPSVMMEAFMKLNNTILESDVELAQKLLPFQKEVIRKSFNL